MWIRATEIERHCSPDGRLLLETIGDFDPRDIHEISEQRRAHVRDAATGATLIDLRAINLDSRFEWPADGGLLLIMAGGVRIGVAADGASWWINDDKAAREPIATAQQRLTELLAPPIRRSWRDRLRQFGTVAAILVVVAAAAAVGWQYSRGELKLRNQLYTAPESPAQPVNAWLLRCPAPLGLVPMHLGADGRLVVPSSIAPRPLARLGEGRYGDGAAAVAFDGTTVTIRLGGPTRQAVPCASAAPAATIGSRPAPTG